MEESPKLLGYRAHAVPPSKRPAAKGAGQGVCTFIKKGITFVEGGDLLAKESILESCTTETVVGKKRKGTLLVVNAYSNPQHRSQRFRTIFQKILQKAAGSPAVVAGDFNAPHQELGYPRTTAKGKSLLDEAEAMGFTLLSNPQQPSRIGTSTARDTTPDLAFVLLPQGGNVTWENTGTNLGSDHNIIEITVPLGMPVSKIPQRKQRLTDWNAFRSQALAPEIENLDEWTSQLATAVARATEEIEGDEDLPNMDPKLAHLIVARRSLQQRWRKQRQNRTLRKRVAQLGREIDKYSRQLCAQQWRAVCNEMDGQLHVSRTWKLLRHLRDETQSKSYQQHRLSQIMHAAIKEHGESEVCRRLNDNYLPATAQYCHPEYQGPDNLDLDADIQEWEVRQVLQDLNCKSAAGPDKISNKALRNLNDTGIAALTKYYNRCWREGFVPKQWRTALTVLIPKPNKPPGIDNLRPISLTSCMGKVLEHVLNRRWTEFMETKELYPPTMLGFRAKLSTQDAMLMIHKDLLEAPSKVDNRAILGLDVKSAFDNVLHSAILKQVETLGLGKRTYAYIRAFLTDRTARLQVGELQLEERKLGSMGTPQGAVISPFLFNLVMIPVARRLSQLEHVRHTIYADDVTIWVKGGPTGRIEECLQAAVRQVEEGLRGTGLHCSPQKSELLILPPSGRNRKSAEAEAAKISVQTSDGADIPRVSEIRVLGMHINTGTGNHAALTKITTKIGIASRLVKQITSRRSGLREENLLRLLQSFVVSHVAYVGAFHRWQQHEKDKINAAIRKAYKSALGLLGCTRNSALAGLGVHNTLDEISEAQRISQLVRLGTTTTGRSILQAAGMNPLGTAEDADGPPQGKIDRQLLQGLVVPPLPKNMHPTHDVERRTARAKALAHTYGDDRHAYFVDVARVPRRRQTYVTAIVRASSGQLVNACSVEADSPEQAEEVAIALALKSANGIGTILSDSKSAIKNYGRGRVGPKALTLLPRGLPSHVYLRWFPAHMGSLPGGVPNRNEEADVAARELAHRVATPPDLQVRDGHLSPNDEEDAEEDQDPVLSYGELLRWHRDQRRTFPPPHPKLTKQEEVTLRRLQTDSVVTPALARHVAPGLYKSDLCSVCKTVPATLGHLLCECSDSDTSNSSDGVRPCVPDEIPVDFMDLLRSGNHELQRAAVQRLERALARQERTEETPSSSSPAGIS